MRCSLQPKLQPKRKRDECWLDSSIRTVVARQRAVQVRRRRHVGQPGRARGGAHDDGALGRGASAAHTEDARGGERGSHLCLLCSGVLWASNKATEQVGLLFFAARGLLKARLKRAKNSLVIYLGEHARSCCLQPLVFTRSDALIKCNLLVLIRGFIVLVRSRAAVLFLSSARGGGGGGQGRARGVLGDGRRGKASATTKTNQSRRQQQCAKHDGGKEETSVIKVCFLLCQSGAFFFREKKGIRRRTTTAALSLPRARRAHKKNAYSQCGSRGLVLLQAHTHARTSRKKAWAAPPKKAAAVFFLFVLAYKTHTRICLFEEERVRKRRRMKRVCARPPREVESSHDRTHVAAHHKPHTQIEREEKEQAGVEEEEEEEEG